MNTCSRCGASLNPQSRFCTNCGDTGAGLGPRARFWGPLAVGAIVLLGVAWSLNAAGILTLPGRERSSGIERGYSETFAGISRPAASAAPSVADAGSESVAALPVDGTEPAPVAERGQGMPEDVLAWLRHMKRIDDRLQELEIGLVSSASSITSNLSRGGFEDTDAGRAAASGDDARRKREGMAVVGDYEGAVGALIRDFQGLAPPPACRPIAGHYGKMLVESRAMLAEVSQAIEDLDIDRLLALQGRSAARADAEAESAWFEIQRVCNQYSVAPSQFRPFLSRPQSPISAGSAGAMSGYGDLLRDLMDDDGG